MKNYKILITLVLISCGIACCSQTQSESSIYSKDYETFRKIFESANSGLYKYHSKAAVDSVFRSGKIKADTCQSLRSFYNVIWEVIDFTGSCHNSLHYPEQADNILNAKEIFFPIPLIVINDTLRSNGKFYSIPLGSEISTINGIEHDEFVKRVSKYSSTDGSNTTGKIASLDSDWLAFYIYLAIGEQNQFKVSYIDTEGISNSVKLPAVTYNEFLDHYDEKHSAKYEDYLYRDDYSYVYLPEVEAGLLTVRSFALGHKNSVDHKAYKLFLDSVFTSLIKNSVDRLILDIRGNGGGEDPNDILLFSYLTQRPFRENTSAYTVFQTVPFPEYFIEKEPDDIKYLELELIEEHSDLKDGKYYQNESFNPYWEPDSLAFKGEIYLLVDPWVASAASLFGSMVKSDGHKVIGEETAGGYYGHTGHIPVEYELPETKLLLTFFIVNVEQDVVSLPDEFYEEGIIPDTTVIQNFSDYLIHKDTQLEFVISQLSLY